MLREMEDEDTLFDKQTLLNSESHDPEIDFSGQKSDWCSKFIKTIVLSIAFFALGLCIAIPGPTLLDLGERVQTDTEHMSMIFTARSVGYLLGSIIGGFLFDHFDQQILMFYTLVLSAIATVIAPWCTALVVLAVMISFQGVSMGILDTGGNVFCIQIWKHKSAPYMQGLHFAFAVGAFIAPLLASPFFSSVLQLNHANDSLISLPHGITPVVPSVPDFALQTHPSESHLVKRRDITNPTATPNISSTTTVGNISFSNSYVSNNSNISTSTVTTTVAEIKHAKPGFANGEKLSKEFADGENAKDSIKDSSKVKVQGDKKSEEESDVKTLTKSGVTVTTASVVSATVSSGKLVSVTPPDNTSSSESLGKNTTATVLTVSSSTTQTTTTTTQRSTTSTQASTSTVRSSTLASATTQKVTSSTGEKMLSSTTLNDDNLITHTANVSTFNQSGLFNLSLTTTERPKKPETFGDFVHKTLNAVAHMSRIQFAYAIIGILLIVNAFMFLVLYCKDKQYSQSQRRADLDIRRYGEESTSFRVVMLIVLFLFFFAYVGMEVTFGGLLSTFVVEYLNWTKSQGATATAVFWGSLAAGRGICIFVAKCFKPPCMLVTNTILVVIGALILSFGIQVSDIFLWVGTVTIGFGMSSIFPTGISWADHYFPLTGKATAVFVVGSALGEMAIPVLTGYLYENKDKMALMYMMVAVGLFCAILYVIMQCIASHKQKISTSSKNGFLRLDVDDNIPMDSLAASYGSSGYVEQAHKRQGTSLKSVKVDNHPEYDRLIDIDD